MTSSQKVLSRNNIAICGAWNCLVLIELDFAMIFNDEHLNLINTNDDMESNVSFVSFVMDSE